MQKFQFEKLDSFLNANGEQTTAFCLKALEKSKGITIGNTLRRVLLTDLKGTAITAIRVHGTNHEYDTIPGVREDILELILNLKQIKFEGILDEPYFCTLDIKGASLVTAADIEIKSGLRIINPNQYIVTVSEGSIFKLEFQIESGCGYRVVTDEINRDSGCFLNIDAVFTPVKNVSYDVFDSYNFDEKEVEDLHLEITTDGSLTPSEALLDSSQNLGQLFSSLDVCESGVLESPEEFSSREIFIEELQLSVRAYNCLKRAGIRTIEDLMQFSVKELKEIKNFGQKSANEVIQKLEDRFDIRLN